MGAVRSIGQATVDSTFTLDAGDLAVLYTDGLTEARRDGRQLGLEAICDLVRAHADETPATINSAIVRAVHEWTPELEDDVSVIVLRQLPV